MLPRRCAVVLLGQYQCVVATVTETSTGALIRLLQEHKEEGKQGRYVFSRDTAQIDFNAQGTNGHKPAPVITVCRV